MSELDWQLADEVMAVSDNTREWVLDHARQAERDKARARALRQAEFNDVIDNRLLDGVKNSIVRTLERDGEQAGNALRSRMGKRERRDLFDQAVALLENDGLVVSIQVDRGVRYRLSRVQGEPPVQGMYSQVNDHEPIVQGEPDATVTELDTRRSHDPARPKLSCQKWLRLYVEELRAAGHTTVESFAVVEAGQSQGYTKGSIHQAVSAHPDMRTVERKRGRAIWSITPDYKPPRYESAAAWLDTWLDKQASDTITPDDAKIAGEAAGHPWQSVRRAAGLSLRIESVPAHGEAKNDRVWKIVTTSSEESAS